MKKTTLFFVFILACYSNMRGQEMWFWHMNNIQQSYVNPAYVSDHKYQIALANYGFDVNTSGLGYGGSLTKTDGKYLLNLGQLGGLVNLRKPLIYRSKFNTFDFGFKIQDYDVYVGHAVSTAVDFGMSNTFVDLLTQGNTSFLGKPLNLTVGSTSDIYSELYAGAAKRFGPLAVGAKVKYLNGMYSLYAPKASVNFLTKEEYYQFEIFNDIDIKTTGLLEYDDLTDKVSFNTSPNLFKRLITRNHGVGFDLGATYDITEDFKVMASVRDLGFIKWKSDAISYANKNSFSYEGFNIDDILDGKDIDFSAFDTIGNIVKFDRNTVNGYSSPMRTQFTLGGAYTYEKFTGSIVYNNTSFGYDNAYELNFQGSYKIVDPLHLGLTYAIRNGNFTNLGFMFQSEFGPVNLYFVTNNLFTTALINPLVGANCYFGTSIRIGNLNKRGKYNQV